MSIDRAQLRPCPPVRIIAEHRRPNLRTLIGSLRQQLHQFHVHLGRQPRRTGRPNALPQLPAMLPQRPNRLRGSHRNLRNTPTSRNHRPMRPAPDPRVSRHNPPPQKNLPPHYSQTGETPETRGERNSKGVGSRCLGCFRIGVPPP